MSDKNEKKQEEKHLLRNLLVGILVAGGVATAIVNFILPKLWPDNEPPVAQININSKKGEVPFKIVCDGAKSQDPEGKALTYEWLIDGVQKYNKSSFEETFTVPKFYHIELRVKDSKGLQGTDSIIVEVTQPISSHTPTPSPIPSPPKSIDKGLVDHYKFEESLIDSSGKNNHGRGFGGITYVDGVLGKAVSFDGVDNYISIQSSKALNPDKELTISLWIKLTSLHEGWAAILHKGGPTKSTKNHRDYSNREYNFQFGNPDLLHFTTSGDNQIGQTVANIHLKNLSPTTWFHYVVTVDKLNRITKAYLNGTIEVVSKDHYGSFNNNGYDLTIGWSAEYGNAFSGNYLNGVIDDLRIYNRVLSDSEISDLYKYRKQ